MIWSRAQPWVARTLIDLAAVVDGEELEAADPRCGNTLCRSCTLTVGCGTWARRAGVASKGGGGYWRTGADRPADSRRENRVVRELVAAGLPRPVRQFELRDASGLIARFDLAYPDRKIGVEFDSSAITSAARPGGRIKLGTTGRRRWGGLCFT